MSTSNVETRYTAGTDELGAAQDMSEAMATLIDQMVAGGKQNPGIRERVASFEAAFMRGEINVRAEITYAADGLVAYQIFALKGGRPPALIFDVIPTRKLDS